MLFKNVTQNRAVKTTALTDRVSRHFLAAFLSSECCKIKTTQTKLHSVLNPVRLLI